MPRYIGLLNVLEKIGKVAYRLELPPSMKMHLVLHASLLQPWRENGNVQAVPPHFRVNGDFVLFTVDRILDIRPMQRADRRNNLKEFLIRWEGYEPNMTVGILRQTFLPSR